ncbi:MAG TPA: carboxypeptidase-like regulatory domain-containing protein [Vicinamibacterales bacterium]|nr:carboxypeptidase-like regulatory domain-containing protein [Vicinamibacterales bacterium]
MPRFLAGIGLGIGILTLGSLLDAQGRGGGAADVPPGQQPRDPAALQNTERRIPVGTSSIAGTVVTADTGRPIAGARVMVSGQVTPGPGASAAAAAQAGGRGAGTGAAVMPPGVQARGSLVQVQFTSSVSRTVMTDASGAFSFPRLPAGNFTVQVSHSEYLAAAYGQTRYGGQGKFVTLTDGQQATLKMPLQRGGVITGMVIGPDGEPIRNAQVRTWRVDITTGFRRLQGLNGGQTDDRGVYRIFGLTPGEYFVSATPNSNGLLMSQTFSQSEIIERAIASGPVNPPSAPGQPSTVSVSIPVQIVPTFNSIESAVPNTYLPTFSPSSPIPSGGTSVTVAAAEEKIGVDVRVQMTQATTIRGTLTTPLDPGVTLQLSLMSEDTSIDSPQTMTARTDANGTFMFRGVAPGNYTVLAQTMASQPPITIVNGQPSPVTQPPPVLTDAQKMWGKTRVTVAGEPAIPINVTLKPALSISGVVTAEMAQPPDFSRMRATVALVSAPSPQSISFGALPQAQVDAGGRFTLTGVIPGRYTVRVSAGPLKSAMVGGEDILDFPLEITGDRSVTDAVLTMTDQMGELNGSLLDGAGKPAEGCTIIAFATDNRFWRPGSRRISTIRPGPDGRYTIRSLPAGSYQLAAVLDMEQGAQFDPEFLRTLSRASVPITIAAGGKVTQDLRVK